MADAVLRATADPPAVRMCAWQRRNKRPCGRASSWIKGEDFDGGEITYYSRFCEYHEIKARQDGIPTDLVADGSTNLAEFDLVRPDPVACALWIEERRGHWSEKLRDWACKIGIEHPMPFLEGLHAAARSEAGWYRPATHGCHYVLPYAMSQPGYDATIAHEVCHAFQKALVEQPASHGEIFELLFRTGCGIAASQRECLRYHAYDVQDAITLSKRIAPVVAAAKADGTLREWVKMR